MQYEEIAKRTVDAFEEAERRRHQQAARRETLSEEALRSQARGGLAARDVEKTLDLFQ